MVLLWAGNGVVQSVHYLVAVSGERMVDQTVSMLAGDWAALMALYWVARLVEKMAEEMVLQSVG